MTSPAFLKKRSAGMLLHISSLPGGHGVGDLGPEAYRFIDFLQASGLSWWQMLPIGPADGGAHSPYDAASAFAIDPLWISVDGLIEQGWLKPSDVPKGAGRFEGSAQFVKAWQWKEPLLRLAWTRFQRHPAAGRRGALEDFGQRERFWLDDFALFSALCAERKSHGWTGWPKALRHRDPAALRDARERMKDQIGFMTFLQFLADEQWARLQAYARERGIGLIGDVPMYMALSSADVWSNQSLFQLDEDGKPVAVAGVPPDYFSEDGQRWGHPLYRWDVLKHSRYEWWRRRFETLLRHFEVVRLDHFIGFERYWEIPAREKTARGGRYVAGPGADFFHVCEKRIGGLPFIAEDLGVVTPEVRALRDAFGLPGMRILQFSSEAELAAAEKGEWGEELEVIYTGTHDNDTLAGWLKSRKIHRPSWDFVRQAFQAKSRIAIVPAQDVLGLDSSARMNRPGVSKGNWIWRLKPGQLTAANASALREALVQSRRLDSSRRG